MPNPDELLEAMNNGGEEEAVEEETANEEEGGEEAATEEDETGSETTGDEGSEGDEEEGDEEGEEASGEEEEASGEEDEPDFDSDAEPTKPVPVKTFLKQKKKSKEREATLRQEIEALKTAQPAPGQASEIQRQHADFVGKSQKAASASPEVAEVLSAIEQGREPNWRALHQALDARVKALPNVDPATQAMLNRQQEVLDGLQRTQRETKFATERTKENETIRTKFKDVDDTFIKVVNGITVAAVKAMPEGAFVAPDRVEIATLLNAFRKSEREAFLKKSKSTAPAKKGAGLPKPKGGGTGKPKDETPWPDAFQDPDGYAKRLAKEMEKGN